MQEHQEVADLLRDLVRDDGERGDDAELRSARKAPAMIMPSVTLWNASPSTIIQPARRSPWP